MRLWTSLTHLLEGPSINTRRRRHGKEPPIKCGVAIDLSGTGRMTKMQTGCGISKVETVNKTLKPSGQSEHTTSEETCFVPGDRGRWLRWSDRLPRESETGGGWQNGSDFPSCQLEAFPYRLPSGNFSPPTACRREAKGSFPLAVRTAVRTAPSRGQS